MTSNKYDVIIIGAGIGGLTAGAILARNGKKVLVLEKNPVAGGYAVNFKRKGFEFDASLHLINGCEWGGQTFKILEECGISDKVEFLKPKFLFRSVYPDFDFKIPQCSPEGIIDVLSEYFPNEKDGLRRLLIAIRAIAIESKHFLNSPSSIRIKTILSLLIYPNLFHYSKLSCQNMFDKFIKDHILKSIVGQLWPFYGLSLNRLSSVYFAYPTYDYIANGGYYPKDGSSSIIDSLVYSLKTNGSNVIFNSEVKEIIVENNIARGIKLKSEEVFLSRSIISNTDPRATFINLIKKDSINSNFLNRIKKMKPSISAFQVHLGLNMDLRENESFASDYEVFINPNYDLESQYFASLNNDPSKMLFSVTLYSNLQNNFAPRGKSAIAITALSGYEFWNRLTSSKYDAEKERFANILIERTGKFISNLSSSIEIKEISTPLTMERYTGNYKGAIYGWENSIYQCGERRSFLTTPVKNLHLSSAWTYPGSGISGTMYAGFVAAKFIIQNKKH